MGASGNWLILQRLVTVTAFKLLRLIFTTVQSLYWQLNGTAQKLRETRDPQNYGRCAQVLDIVLVYKFCGGEIFLLTDVLCTHNRFEDPQYIIDNDHITLATITDQCAVFMEAREKGMHLWKSEFTPFIKLSQRLYCNKLIVVPLYAFHRMAEKIGDPKAELIFLFNAGRCGSTLLAQVMEYTGRCVTVSEPNTPNLLATKYRREGDSPELRQLSRDVIRWECRPYPSLQPPPLAYMVKIMAWSTVAMPFFRDLYPNSRCLYMYRDAVAINKSLHRMSYQVPSLRLDYLLAKWSSSITAAIVNFHGYSGKDFQFRLPDNMTFGFLLVAVTMKAYVDTRKKDFDVSAVRYEDLVARPLESCRRILEYCGLPVSLASLAVKALEKDSQRNSVIAKSTIGKHKEPEMSRKSKASLDELMKKFGLPPIGEEIILEGTITCDV